MLFFIVVYLHYLLKKCPEFATYNINQYKIHETMTHKLLKAIDNKVTSFIILFSIDELIIIIVLKQSSSNFHTD